MAIRQLKYPEIAADGVEGLAVLDGRAAAKGAWRNRAGLGPGLKLRISKMVAQALKVDIHRREGKSENSCRRLLLHSSTAPGLSLRRALRKGEQRLRQDRSSHCNAYCSGLL